MVDTLTLQVMRAFSVLFLIYADEMKGSRQQLLPLFAL